MNTKPLTQEEIYEFNSTIAKMGSDKVKEKKEILNNLKSKIGDEQSEYVRSVIKTNKQ